MFNFLVNLWQSLVTSKARSSDGELSNVSCELTQRIEDLVRDLPNSPTYQQAVSSALESACQQWLENPRTSSNSMVVLSNPIQPIASILENSQSIIQTEQQISINSLSWERLPAEPHEILANLQAQLERESEYPEIISIPYLSSFFLRCINGLEGIEYIRSIVRDRTRFWIIGSHDWAWRYLDLGCQIDSYFNQSIMLPALDHQQLQDWLASIITETKITFGRRSLKQKAKPQRSLKQVYFKKLTEVSKGCGSLALQLFLRSLEYQSDSGVSDEVKVVAIVDNLSLPKLPNLSIEEQYLLSALLLHGSLSLSHLSFTLGQIDSIVKSLVLRLENAELLEQKDELIRVNPIYYFQIENLLTKNSFVLTQKLNDNYQRTLFR